MKVVIFGLGYVGVTVAACIARNGHEVVGIDVSAAKVDAVNAGASPIVEPEIGPMLAEAQADGRLGADTEIGAQLVDADMAMVCVGTPSAPDGAHDMRDIAEVTRQIAAAAKARPGGPLTVVYRSTMRPGSIEGVVLPLFRAQLGDAAEGTVRVVYNPEFLREGSAARDYFNPPKIVFGTADSRQDPALDAFIAGIDAPVFYTGYREAEIAKLLDNSWHATKIAFANEIGRVCGALEISASQVHEVFVADTKLNVSAAYLRPGGAFGGSCLPKDVRALRHLGGELGASMPLIGSVLDSNEAHKAALYERAVAGIAPGARVLLAGLAFKHGTDDLRESPNLDLARRLLDAGFELEIYDPFVAADSLVGANLGHAFSRLPRLETLLVDRAAAEAGRYDRVIAAHAAVRDLRLAGEAEVVDLGALV